MLTQRNLFLKASLIRNRGEQRMVIVDPNNSKRKANTQTQETQLKYQESQG